jgi:DNA-binding NtrC family response regulator
LNPSLLIVDDDMDQLSTLSRWFSRRGYHVVTANHPRQALVAVGAGQFHAAIVDASLPEIDGLDLMKRLKRLQYNLPVIILSGYDFSNHAAPENWSSTDSAFACLMKPCDLGLLETTVTHAMYRRIDELPTGEQVCVRRLH